jgi:hypothetical protein
MTGQRYGDLFREKIPNLWYFLPVAYCWFYVLYGYCKQNGTRHCRSDLQSPVAHVPVIADLIRNPLLYQGIPTFVGMTRGTE